MTQCPMPQAVHEAIEWLALQRSGTMSAEQRQQFAQWLRASPEHDQAWRRLQQRLGQAFSELPAHSRQVLASGGHSRRQLLRGALGLTGVGIGGWWLQRHGLLPRVGSDLATGTAQRRPFLLEDGSRVLLNAQSRVDLRFSPQQRTLILREGALNIQVAPDPNRPLVVRTPFGEARALGTRFSVILSDREAQVWVQESRVQLEVPGHGSLTLGADQGAVLDPRGIRPLDPRQATANAWENGQLVVHDQALGEVLDALRAYHRGWLRISPPAAALRVTGVFALDDSVQALRSLQEVLPIKVEQHLGGWTQVSLR